MKIAIAQLNYHIGNFKLNIQKIIDEIKNAKNQKADLIIFSELSICGYPPLDLLENNSFLNKCEQEIKHITSHCDNIAAIIGAPVLNKDKGKKLFNAALFINKKQVKHIVKKTLLPNYDVFNESRYFEINKDFNIIEYKEKRIALTICEDLWDDQYKDSYNKKTLYKISPLKILSAQNPDLIINIAASPYSYNQKEIRKNIISKKSRKYKLPVIYVNQIGGNTDIIFDGGSFVMNKNGEIVVLCKYFREETKIINTPDIDKLNPQIQQKENKIESIYNALIIGIKDFFSKNGFSKAILGLSGGIDSSLCLALAVNALGNKNVEVILMPSKYSSQHSIDDSIEMAKKTNVKYHIIDIENIRLNIENKLERLFKNSKPDTTEENIQARIRSIILMAFANKFGHILLNTSNKSETAVGYTTLYGDMSGGLSVLGDVYKTDVYKLSKFINKHIQHIIPDNIIKKEPSAELSFNQKDTDTLPEYNILDKILFYYIEKKFSSEKIHKLGFNENIVNKVINLVNTSEYKRFQSPPILRISSKAFGRGRKIPLETKY